MSVNSGGLPDSQKLDFISTSGLPAPAVDAFNRSARSFGSSGWPKCLQLFLRFLLKSPVPSLLYWGDEKLLYYNAAYLDLRQKDSAEIPEAGRPETGHWAAMWQVIERVTEDILAGRMDAWGREIISPLMIENSNGSPSYWSFTCTAVDDDELKTGGVLVTCTNNTALRSTIRELEISKNEYRDAVEAAELGTFDVDTVNNSTKVNSRLRNWFGLADDAGELTESVFNSIAAADRPRVISAIQRALDFDSGGIYNIEYSIINPVTQHEIIVKAKGKTVFGPDKKPLRFTGTLQDISAEALTRRQVEQSEKEFRQLADALPELVWATDKDGKRIFASSRWQEFTGLDPNDESSFQKMVHPEDMGKMMTAWTGALVSGENYSTEARLKNSEGEYQWFRVNGEPFRNASGDIEKWIGTLVNINPQKNWEQHLINALNKVEESERRFRTVADSAPVLIWMSGTNTQCSFVNKAWQAFTGRNLEAELEAGWAEGVHPADQKKCLDTYLDAFNRREPFYMEYRQLRHDGQYRWISDSGVPLFSSEDVFEGYIGACMDIHDSVTARQLLKENESTLKIIIDASELGTWELDMETDIVQYSGRYREIFGLENDAVLPHGYFVDRLFPEDAPIRLAAWSKARENGVLNYVCRICWPDNSVHWIEVKGQLFYSAQEIPFKVIGTLRDITAQKNYEQALEERELKFRLLSDTIPQLVWTAEPSGKLTYFNAAVQQYSGLDAETLSMDGLRNVVHPDERTQNSLEWKACLQSGKDFFFEHRLRRSDGEYRWQLTRAVPQRDANGIIQLWVGSSTDIHELKELDKQKDYFISMASHELKTPVTSIKGYLQLLQKIYGSNGDAFLKNSLTIADRQVDTLTRLITELLDLSKIKTGNLSLHKEAFDLGGLLTETIQNIKNINPAWSVEFSYTQPVTVMADRERIGQVVINFLNNAIKYSPGSPKVSVRMISRAGNTVEVEVEDWGIGILLKDQERIFERFYRVEGKNEKTFPGFGIGLFIAAEIVHRHQGKVGVKSEPGKGSVFSFRLPALNQPLSPV